MFQPDNHPLQSIDSFSSHSGSDSQAKRRLQVLSNPSAIASQLRSSVPANISPNKKAVIERLITLYAQGALQ